MVNLQGESVMSVAWIYGQLAEGRTNSVAWIYGQVGIHLPRVYVHSSIL